MRVLIGHERSGRTRDAFIARGHDAWSCDLAPTARPGPHHQCDIFKILGPLWDFAIFHPDCTYLCSSGLHWNTRPEGLAVDRQGKTEESLLHVCALMNSKIKKWVVENPIGCISTRIKRTPAGFFVVPKGVIIPKKERLLYQIIQPNQFGEDASKATCLFLHGVLPLRGTNDYPPPV